MTYLKAVERHSGAGGPFVPGPHTLWLFCLKADPDHPRSSLPPRKWLNLVGFSSLVLFRAWPWCLRYFPLSGFFPPILSIPLPILFAVLLHFPALTYSPVHLRCPASRFCWPVGILWSTPHVYYIVSSSLCVSSFLMKKETSKCFCMVIWNISLSTGSIHKPHL